MPTIKFSHNYPKLWNQKIARLLDVHVTLLENLDEDLIEYDTRNCHGDYYKLPKGELIVLTFSGGKLIPFSTIRRWTKKKEEYYRTLIGRDLGIEITALTGRKS